jgi:hypothetical protein
MIDREHTKTNLPGFTAKLSLSAEPVQYQIAMAFDFIGINIQPSMPPPTGCPRVCRMCEEEGRMCGWARACENAGWC